MRWLPLLILAVACAKSVVPEYDARKAAALSPPREVPAGWEGDGALMLSTALVDRLVKSGLDRSGVLKRKVELGTRAHFTPDLRVESLRLSPSDACETCVRVSTNLDGECTWRLGASSGNRPLAGSIDFDGEIQAVRDADSWTLQFVPRRVNSAKLVMGGKTFRTVARMADAAVQDWATKRLFENMKPLNITRFEGADLPLRAVRVVPEPAGVRIDLLTEAPAVDLVDPAPLGKGEDWTLTLSQNALLHVARKAAFEQGVLAYNVAAEPTGLQLDKGTFILDLRLWRLSGRGWWRDVRVRGTWTKTNKGFDFQAVEADEVARSKGARVVDPLAALGEGRILHAVENAVSRSVPGGASGKVGGISIEPVVVRVAPVREQITAGGTAQLGGGKGSNRR